jgi:hypothetical protein
MISGDFSLSVSDFCRCGLFAGSADMISDSRSVSEVFPEGAAGRAESSGSGTVSSGGV